MRSAIAAAVVLFIGLGQSISGWQSPVIGFALMIAAAILLIVWLASHPNVADRLPFEIRRRRLPQASPAPAIAGGTSPGDRFLDPVALGSYLESINQTMEAHGFGPNPRAESTRAQITGPAWDELNTERLKRYQDNQGLFLVHAWKPSDAAGQHADVTIKLAQHDAGPLSRGDVEAVEYTLGPKFSNHSLVCADPTNEFAIHVSMWGPMLCLARVHLANSQKPLLLERYIDFDAARTDSK